MAGIRTHILTMPELKSNALDRSATTLHVLFLLFREKEEKVAKESLPDLLSSDMHREMMRKKWEAEEEEMRARGPGPLHYQNVRFDGEN